MSLVSLDGHLSAGASEKQEAKSTFCVSVWPVPHKMASFHIGDIGGRVWE